MWTYYRSSATEISISVAILKKVVVCVKSSSDVFEMSLETAAENCCLELLLRTVGYEERWKTKRVNR